MKCLTVAQMQAHQDKGLCYNSDKCFHVSHCFKCKFFLLLADPSHDLMFELSPMSIIPLETLNTSSSVDDHSTSTFQLAQISLHALKSYSQPQTSRVKGQISSSLVQVLIDCGNAHNFMFFRGCL